jgi:hypothetical protein
LPNEAARHPTRSWEVDVVFDPGKAAKSGNVSEGVWVELDLNDPHLMFEVADEAAAGELLERAGADIIVDEPEVR